MSDFKENYPLNPLHRQVRVEALLRYLFGGQAYRILLLLAVALLFLPIHARDDFLQKTDDLSILPLRSWGVGCDYTVAMSAEQSFLERANSEETKIDSF